MFASHVLDVCVVDVSAERAEAVDGVLHEGLNPDTFVRVVLARIKSEDGQERSPASHAGPLCADRSNAENVLVVLVTEGHHMVGDRLDVTDELVFRSLKLV